MYFKFRAKNNSLTNVTKKVYGKSKKIFRNKYSEI